MFINSIFGMPWATKSLQPLCRRAAISDLVPAIPVKCCIAIKKHCLPARMRGGGGGGGGGNELPSKSGAQKRREKAMRAEGVKVQNTMGLM